MTGTEFAFLVVGLLIGAFIIATFDGVRFWGMFEETKTLKSEVRMLEEALTDAREGQHPREWKEQSGVNVIADTKREGFDRRRFTELNPDIEIVDLTEAENNE